MVNLIPLTFYYDLLQSAIVRVS